MILKECWTALRTKFLKFIKLFYDCSIDASVQLMNSVNKGGYTSAKLVSVPL